jgi:hypothetical protein
MSALAEGWTTQRRWRISLSSGFCWWGGAFIGGAIGGLVLQPHSAVVSSAIAVALLQALAFRSDFRYGAAWFGATAVAGAIGFGAAVVGGLAFAEAAIHNSPVLGQASAAWLVLSALGGLLLAAAQAPLTGRRDLAWGWCILGLFAGGVLWPAGLVLGHWLGPELSAQLALVYPQSPALKASIVQATAFAAAWLLHSLPFGVIVTSASGERR